MPIEPQQVVQTSILSRALPELPRIGYIHDLEIIIMNSYRVKASKAGLSGSQHLVVANLALMSRA